MNKRVTLLSNIKKDIPESELSKIIEKLSSLGCTVYVSSDDNRQIFSMFTNIEKRAQDELFDGTDFIVVAGGDGSMLEAARLSAGSGIPLIGINFGRLGYLAELEVGELVLLEKVVSGDYKIEERMMLDVEIDREGHIQRLNSPCLNETVFSNAPISRLASFVLYCNGEAARKYKSDGIIVSTPTGSSAYSLSAGGPLVYQTMKCIIVTPICAHSFMQRPVVFTDDCIIEVKNASCRENKLFITVDGRDNIEIFSSDIIRIKKSDLTTKLIRVKEGGFINNLYGKLGNN